MKKTTYLLLLTLYSLPAWGQPYKNPALPVEERVQDLLARMTPAEKFWQLFMIPGEVGADSSRLKGGIFGFQVSAAGQEGHAAGQLLRYESGSSAREAAEQINDIQRFFVEESRLGIPIIPFDEALHGLARPGATAFPQAIGLAATWNAALMHEAASAIAGVRYPRRQAGTFARGQHRHRSALGAHRGNLRRRPLSRLRNGRSLCVGF
jgi:beta-glucosidase